MTIKFIKMAAVVASASLLMSLTANAAFAAADSSANVAEDGDSYSYTEDNDHFNVDNHQNGWVANYDFGVGFSGGNRQNGNDDDNEMGTGAADGSGASDNFLNSNVSILEDTDVASATSDAMTGEDGDSSARAFDNDDISVRNRNRGSLENLTVGAAISGFNSQSWNDDENSMSTGDTDAMAMALNEVNNNWTMIGGSHGASATAEVGDDGDSYAYAEDNDRFRVYNHNHARVETASIALAISGGNTQSGNDDNNSMDTGEGSATSSVSNFVNNNVTVVGSHDDSGSATSTATTGEDGDSTSDSRDNDSVTVTNSNDAEVENVSVAAGVTGGNTQSDNDDGNSMTTGAASGSSCSTNTVNSSWTVIGGSLPEGGAQGCN